MQKSRDYAEWYSRYIDDELSAEEKQAFLKYLDENPQEKAIVQRLQSLQQNLAQLPPTDTSEGFETVLRTRIQIEKKIGYGAIHTFFQRWRMPFLGFATALVVFLVFSGLKGIRWDGMPTDETAVNHASMQNSLSLPASNINYTLDQFIASPSYSTDAASIHYQPAEDETMNKNQGVVVDSTGKIKQETTKTIPENLQLSY
ncbi:MAG: hypothetical protein DWQ10_15745 [Calditrichaeota bacterium]|nr:MAG: hypothetical protein DWQ10_15745 [Calditrichota bacterium]